MLKTNSPKIICNFYLSNPLNSKTISVLLAIKTRYLVSKNQFLNLMEKFLITKIHEKIVNLVKRFE